MVLFLSPDLELSSKFCVRVSESRKKIERCENEKARAMILFTDRRVFLIVPKWKEVAKFVTALLCSFDEPATYLRLYKIVAICVFQGSLGTYFEKNRFEKSFVSFKRDI